MQFGAWLRFAVQNVALLHQTSTVWKASNLQSTSLGASWLFMLSSIFGVIYAFYSKAPIVYAAASGFSVACQGFMLAKLYSERLRPVVAAQHE